nr:hypothetical protein pPsy0462b_00023 [Pseudomonas syringae]
MGVVDRGDQVQIKPGFNEDDELDNYRLAANLVSTKSGDAVRIVGDEQFVDQVLDAGCAINHRDDQYVFQVTDPDQMARYKVIERDHRQYYGYDEPARPQSPYVMIRWMMLRMIATSPQGRSLVEARYLKWLGPTFEIYDRVLRRALSAELNAAAYGGTPATSCLFGFH